MRNLFVGSTTTGCRQRMSTRHTVDSSQFIELSAVLLNRFDDAAIHVVYATGDVSPINFWRLNASTAQ
jgi:hypothetical protein